MRQRVAGVIIKNGKILFIHRIKNGEKYYTLPGGGVEEGASLHQALQREMKEELSLDILRYSELFRVDTEERKEVFYVIEEFGGVLEIGGPEKERMNMENQYIITWCDIDNLYSLVGRYLNKEILTKIRTYALSR